MTAKDDPLSWAYELRLHWEAFNACCEIMREKGHHNMIDKFAWREYVIHDLQERHKEELLNDNCMR